MIIDLEGFELDEMPVGPLFFPLFLRLSAPFKVFAPLVTLEHLVRVEDCDGIAERAFGPFHFDLIGQQFLLVRRCEDVLRTETGRHDDALFQNVVNVPYSSTGVMQMFFFVLKTGKVTQHNELSQVDVDGETGGDSSEVCQVAVEGRHSAVGRNFEGANLFQHHNGPGNVVQSGRVHDEGQQRNRLAAVQQFRTQNRLL